MVQKPHRGFLLSALVLLYVLLALVACQTESDSTPRVSATINPTLALCSGGYASLSSIQELPAPAFRQDIGTASLQITTSSTEAQQWFNQGLNLIHGFWHLEAYRAFQQVIQLDAECAMGYWGIAMCQPGFGGDGASWQEAIQKARSLQTKASPFEQAIIEASNVLIHQGIPAALSHFKALMDTYPDEPEASAFAALMMRQSVSNEAESENVKILLEKALQRFPKHSGLQHYYTHVMEVRPDFALAKPIAQKMVELNPGVPHLLHMPGHLFFLEGDYQKAAAVFETARTKERNYHREENIPKAADQNYMHNLHYLAVTYTELNEYEKALEVAREFAYITLQKEAPVDANGLILLYEGRILPARVHIRFGEYKKAADQIAFWLHSPDFATNNPLVRTYLEGMLDYCQSMKALMDVDHELALQYGGQFNQTVQQLQQLAEQQQGDAAYPLLIKILDIMYMHRFKLAGWIDNIKPDQPFQAYAWEEAFRLEAALPYEEPPRLLAPVGEDLLQLHTLRAEAELAAQARQKALQIRPKSHRINAFLQSQQ